MKYLKNTSWLLGEKILRMVVGLFVGIWVARYLGPEQFGLFSYAQSYVLLFSVIATLGLDGIVIRELVHNENQRERLLGTAFTLKLAGALLVIILLVVSILFHWNDSQTNWLIVIIAFATIFQSLNVIDFYFQSQVLSKFVVYSNLLCLLISSLIKVTLILYEAPLISFAYVILFDSFILAIGLLYFYLKENLMIKSWRFEFPLARRLLRDSWPLIISSIVVTVYMKIDIIMLKEFLGEYEVGLYAASSRISELWYVVPVLVTSSLFPAILNAKKTDENIYNNRVRNLYKILIWMAIALSITVTLIGAYLMEFLYGSGYEGAADILIIQIWSSVFIGLLMVSNKWLLAENKTKFIFIRGSAGAVINVGLNYIYIPIYGVQAAAYTSLITLIFTTLLIDMFTPSTRQHLLIKLDGFVPMLRKI
ncbi:flippase [Colwellia sp. PAMC 21821]|uniref:flippase n=1 Tax=Colwellia sp. PAMC 21821 TaxID=1816219 RepID=UPI0012DF92EE|nr:flippase [Colwellia sp. PAMC 21821]